MKDRIVELEKKVAFIDHQLEELNEVIVHQSKIIDEHQSRLKSLSDQFHSGESARKFEDEEPPPHY